MSINIPSLISQDPCAICYEEMEESATKQLNCSHLFHHACIDSWLEMANTCPLCRRVVKLNSPLYRAPLMTDEEVLQVPDFNPHPVNFNRRNLRQYDQLRSLIDEIMNGDDELIALGRREVIVARLSNSRVSRAAHRLKYLFQRN